MNPAAPAKSLLLLKPTGAIPHGGGRRISADSEVAAILRAWLATGMPGPRPDDLRALRLKVEPAELVVRGERRGNARSRCGAFQSSSSR